MPNIDKLLKQSDAGFKRYTGIHKATFYDMFEAMQEHEASKTKSGRPSVLSLKEQILLALTYWREYRTLRFIISVWTLVFISRLLAVSFVK